MHRHFHFHPRIVERLFDRSGHWQDDLPVAVVILPTPLVGVETGVL
jgi:hypothetical protein